MLVTSASSSVPLSLRSMPAFTAVPPVLQLEPAGSATSFTRELCPAPPLPDVPLQTYEVALTSPESSWPLPLASRPD